MGDGDAVDRRTTGEARGLEPTSPRDSMPWLVHGVISGVIGAFLVQLLFLGIDLVMAQPFWTPHALGSALFLGESPAPSPQLVLVLGYTVLHGAVFVSVGMLAAATLPLVPVRRRLALGALTAVALFVVLEGIFALFDVLFVAPVAASPETWAVTLANVLAAVGMGGYLVAGGVARSSIDAL
jgi:hypothetical protein